MIEGQILTQLASRPEDLLLDENLINRLSDSK